MSEEKQTTLEINDSNKGIIYNNEKNNEKKGKRTLKDYEQDMGERGIYNTKNRLNNLTGREWNFFLNSVMETDFAQNHEEFELWKYLQDSVIKTRYPSSGKESYGHNLRKIHPSPKPPQLMRDIIAFFTKSGGWILDPFMGVGGTLIGASLLPDRNAVGIEIEEKYIEVFKETCARNGLKQQTTFCADSRKILEIDDLKNKTFDLILTDPPYANMLSRKRTGGDRKDKGAFTSDERDLGNITYDKFMPELGGIIKDNTSLLKNKGYLVIFCKDMQPTKENHNLLHADIINEICKIPYIYFKGYKIWYDKTINLYPYGYPFSYVSNQLHQFILIFRKEI
jgi:DNA modification methylase